MSELIKTENPAPSEELKESTLGLIKAIAADFSSETSWEEFDGRLAKHKNFALACGATSEEIEEAILSALKDSQTKQRYFDYLESAVVTNGNHFLTTQDLEKLQKALYPHSI